MDPIISFSNLGVKFNGPPVLENISFDVMAGELVGIIGPNGAGKTTLLRTILGLIPPVKGELKVLNKSIDQLNSIRDKIGYMPQTQLFEKRFPLSASDVVSTGLLSRGTILRRLKNSSEVIFRALELVGMQEYIQKPFQDLSGGEQQRILLARALVRNPELLLLDEPNNGLDFPSQQKFNKLLQRLKLENNLTIILVSHDLVSVSAIADRLICINRIMHIHGHPGDVLVSPHLEEAYRCEFDLLQPPGREVHKCD
ncbi:MAG: metal ABC transporter ATP-binding protein [Bacillota bacterium]|nr:metal ABC transporter ATP-binding protein [Bacillota bacterium]